MNINRLNKKRPARMILSLYGLIVLFSMFTVATYTWLTLSRTPEVSDMALYVNSPKGMELSVDPLAEEWVLQLDMAGVAEGIAPLRPVTWSNNDQRFYAASYGLDGRLTDRWEPLSDFRNANKDNLDGYYNMVTFFARCDQKITVSLSPAIEVDEGINGSGTYVIGTPVWDGEEIIHNNGGRGAELAIRIGFMVRKTDLSGQPINEQSAFYIYEPNCDQHVDGTTGYVDTPSIDLTQTMVPMDQMILQTASTWSESDPVERNVVIHSLGAFTTNTELFDLSPDELAQITVYIWMDGQDVDCTNVIGHEAQIMASIQFATKPQDQSGLVPIE